MTKILPTSTNVKVPKPLDGTPVEDIDEATNEPIVTTAKLRDDGVIECTLTNPDRLLTYEKVDENTVKFECTCKKTGVSFFIMNARVEEDAGWFS